VFVCFLPPFDQVYEPPNDTAEPITTTSISSSVMNPIDEFVKVVTPMLPVGKREAFVASIKRLPPSAQALDRTDLNRRVDQAVTQFGNNCIIKHVTGHGTFGMALGHWSPQQGTSLFRFCSFPL
jgi:hypothetical protein